MAGLTYPPAVITTLKVVFPFALGLFLKWHLDFKWLCMTTFIATFFFFICCNSRNYSLAGKRSLPTKAPCGQCGFVPAGVSE